MIIIIGGGGEDDNLEDVLRHKRQAHGVVMVAVVVDAHRARMSSHCPRRATPRGKCVGRVCTLRSLEVRSDDRLCARASEHLPPSKFAVVVVARGHSRRRR